MKRKKLLKTKKCVSTATCLIAIIISFPGCYYDKEEILFPQTACDVSNVTFSRSVVPILSANCYSCHGGNTPSGGIQLDTYTGVKLQADNGKLFGSISHAAGFSPMPKNAGSLSSCNITQIKKWVDAGAPNN
jgi:Planctomycete cytochrome C